MKLRQVILKNFRGYKDEVRIDLDDLTAFIGKNDVGKSTILEALEIFFNNDTVKIEAADGCIFGDKKDVLIGCVFDELPSKVVVDASNPTTLSAEYLLNEDGALEIHKVFNCDVKTTPKEKVFAWAHHPSARGCSNLLKLKIDDLKKKWEDSGLENEEVKLNRSATIRRGLWDTCSDLKLKSQRVSLDDADGKKIWESLKKELPVFALFRSDRASRDDDSEVQDPMKLAVREALKELSTELEGIKDAIQKQVLEVAKRTVKKISEMDSTLAKDLLPHFKSEPKWDSIFKLSLTAEDKVPINKRGSGVRRLVLINFFRAEVERKQKAQGSPGIIYAIEEPETSQHPNYQRMLIEALRELSGQGHCQVLLTTHVPGLAGYLPVESLRYIDQEGDGKQRIRSCDEGVYKEVAETLGIIPDHQVKVFVCVEGPTDVDFFNGIGKLLNQDDPSFPNLETDSRVVVFPLGGSTLKDWVNNHFLRPLNRPEIHIYDRDDQTSPKYQAECDAVNARSDGSWGTLTSRREIENYYHADAIAEVFEVTITFADTDDVPLIIAKTVHDQNSSTPWDDLDDDTKKKKKSRVKRRLSGEVISKMTVERLNEADPNDEIKGWFRKIAESLA